MTEIYVNTQQTVTLDISGNSNPVIESDAAPTAVVVDSTGVSVFTATTSEDFPGQYSFVFPLWLTAAESKYTIQWSYVVDARSYTKTDYIDVVQPYATLDNLRNFDQALAALDDQTLIDLEKQARYMVNNMTAQRFSSYAGTVSVQGESGFTLQLPVRVISLTSVNYQFADVGNLINYGVYLIDNYTLGWMGNFAGWDYNFQTTGVIYAPPVGFAPFFTDNQAYILSGVFGWESVPSDINLATMMLVRDYSGSDDIYRRKGVTSLTTGTLGAEMNQSGSTGNVDVDRILNSYNDTGMAVI